jgi:hypothetical protein
MKAFLKVRFTTSKEIRNPKSISTVVISNASTISLIISNIFVNTRKIFAKPQILSPQPYLI